MKVSQAVASRISCRKFLDQDVPRKTIEDILEQAARAPSGGNLQPWHVNVLGRPAVQEISQIVLAKMQSGTRAEKSEYNIYPPDLKEPYRTRRYRVGEQLYGMIGIPREDKAGRIKQFIENYQFFGAPAALFFSIDRDMCEGQWSDLGMFIQTIMLLAREYGLHTCGQEAWAVWSPSLHDYLGLPDSDMLFCGMAIGYMDETSPINGLRTERATLKEFSTWRGFDI